MQVVVVVVIKTEARTLLEALVLAVQVHFLVGFLILLLEVVLLTLEVVVAVSDSLAVEALVLLA
jgi:hypothetical protein